MANSDVDGGALPAGGRRLSERPAGCRVDTAGAADPADSASRATAQDRHAGGDERHSVFAADRLPPALSAARQLPPRSTVYNIFRKSSAWSLGGDLGRAAYGIARANGSGGQPLGGGSRQPVNQIGRKAVVTTTGGLRRRQRGKGPQDPRPGLQRGAADTSRCPLRRDSGPRRGGFGSRQDTPPLPLLDRSGLKASSTPGRSTLQWKGAAAAPGDRQAARP
jgi:hypothetical protein